MITVSFIIPVYNCKNYLPDCVGSILNAGVSDYEILLIDDGSTDGSGELCDVLAKANSCICVIHQSNAGVSAARNRGLREARGDRVLFIDSDDTVDSVALSNVLKDPRCDQSDLTIFGISFDYYYRGNCYRRDSLYYERSGILTRAEWGADFSVLFDQNSLSSLCNKVFRKSILEHHKLHLNEDLFLYEDFEFTLRYMKHCGSIWNVPQAIYHYRQAEDEGNAGRRLARIDSIPAFLEPIERAMFHITQENTAISAEQGDQILQKLYLILAKEKIAGANGEQISKICLEYQQWVKSRTLTVEVSVFQDRLMRNRAVLLWVSHKKSMIRHSAAVWIKARLSALRKIK